MDETLGRFEKQKVIQQLKFALDDIDKDNNTVKLRDRLQDLLTSLQSKKNEN